MIYKDKEILAFKNIEQIIDYAVGQWTELAEKAIKERGRFTAALSGGRTPVNLYKALAEEKGLPWDRTHIFIVDERFVPFDHKDSNYRMINSTLLKQIEIPAENIHPVITDEKTPVLSAERYENEIQSFFNTIKNGTPQFDLVLLGIGGDGHTASLFPDTPALKETRRLTAAVTPPDESMKERISLTLPVINNAGSIFFMAAGEDKAGVIKEIIEDNSTLPAAMVRPESGKLVFLLDEGAASLLA